MLVAGRQWICFATKIERTGGWPRVPADGGEVQVIPTTGAPNPTEPDWSPDGKWIAFTSQTGEFDICVMPADGSADRGAGAGRGPVVVAQLADADFQPFGPLPANAVCA